jgi:hypothetical protein
MLTGGKKFQKPTKTKFKKNREQQDDKHLIKVRHHDKSFYRLLKQEKDENTVWKPIEEKVKNH